MQPESCVICLDKAAVVCFLPCKHFCSCVECSLRLESTAKNVRRPFPCPLCRTEVISMISVQRALESRSIHSTPSTSSCPPVGHAAPTLSEPIYIPDESFSTTIGTSSMSGSFPGIASLAKLVETRPPPRSPQQSYANNYSEAEPGEGLTV